MSSGWASRSGGSSSIFICVFLIKIVSRLRHEGREQSSQLQVRPAGAFPTLWQPAAISSAGLSAGQSVLDVEVYTKGFGMSDGESRGK